MAACTRPFGSCGFIGGLLYLKRFLPRPLLLPQGHTMLFQTAKAFIMVSDILQQGLAAPATRSFEVGGEVRRQLDSPQAARPYCRTGMHYPAKTGCLWKPSLPLPSQGQSPPPTSMQFLAKIPASSRRTHSCGSSAPSSLRRWWSFYAILCIQQEFHRRWGCSYPSCSVGPGMPSQHHLQLSPCYTQESPGRGEALQGSR